MTNKLEIADEKPFQYLTHAQLPGKRQVYSLPITWSIISDALRCCLNFSIVNEAHFGFTFYTKTTLCIDNLDMAVLVWFIVGWIAIVHMLFRNRPP